MKTDGNDCAYPTGCNCTEGGLTKREYFAAMAMQGLLSMFDDHDELPALAVKAADDLIDELSK